ncbi:hypothetical protein M405DRAFT_812614 [Rhizopogon salebrosus TDB-379]|nr:hypothetical protein M405DRAFT_812614 [Rhizopogon salebrosus TDB-379]
MQHGLSIYHLVSLRFSIANFSASSSVMGHSSCSSSSTSTSHDASIPSLDDKCTGHMLVSGYNTPSPQELPSRFSEESAMRVSTFSAARIRSAQPRLLRRFSCYFYAAGTWRHRDIPRTVHQRPGRRGFVTGDHRKASIPILCA